MPTQEETENRCGGGSSRNELVKVTSSLALISRFLYSVRKHISGNTNHCRSR